MNCQDGQGGSVTTARLTPDGALQVLTMPAGGLLPALYEAIGCRLVEVVTLSESVTMWLDEEGLFADPVTVNLPATRIARAFGITGQWFVGTVVFTGGPDADGDTLSLTDGDLRSLADLLGVDGAGRPAAPAARR